MKKRMFLEMLVVSLMIGAFPWVHMSAYAAEADLSPTVETTEGADEPGKSEEVTDFVGETNLPDAVTTEASDGSDDAKEAFCYYDETLPVEELYCNLDEIANFPTVNFGESTEAPMLASYINDPNWGDHRQFARMAPADLNDNLAAGDSVAKIILQPNHDYWLTEYLVNTAAENGEGITGLKLFIDFPDRMRAGEENYVYAYLNSENDAGGSRVCRVRMICEDEIWLRPVGESLMGIRHGDDDQPTFFTDWQFGAQNYQGELRYTLEIEWPEDFNIQGGADNGYFAMVMLETFSENPAKNVIYATEESADELIADTEFTDGYEEYTPSVEDEQNSDEANAQSPLRYLIWLGPLVLLISIIICGRKLWTILRQGRE